MNVAEVLRGAAQEIEKRGLAKGAYFREGYTAVEEHPEVIAANPRIRCCALGAIGVTQRAYNTTHRAASDYLHGYLRERYGNRYLDVPHWNDVKSRTKGQVVSTLRAAADQWEADNGVA